MLKVKAVLLLLLLPFGVLAADNAELRAIKEADQADRHNVASPDQWREVTRRDGQRRGRVLEILKAAQLSTAWDYYNAALVLQHGKSTQDIRLAHALATVGATIDPGHTNSKWLIAASWDRLMVRLKQPQWYGTQSKRGADGKLSLLPVHPDAVTDAERAALGVPSLAQAQAKIAAQNGGM